MQRERKYRVVGVRENGDRVILTKHTSRGTAEKIVTLLTRGSMFTEVVIEEDNDEAE
jgi:hypothetical protein